MHRVCSNGLLACLLAWLSLLVACERDDRSETTQAPAAAVNPGSAPVTVYSSASPALVRPVLEAYTAESGVRTELISDDFPRIAARVENHGSGPVADLVIAGGVSELAELAQHDLLRPSYFADKPAGIAARLADPENVWYPLSYRARVIVYNADNVATEELDSITSFESLREDRWRNRLCISSSRVPGNRALIAALIRAHGVLEAELIVRAWVTNSRGRFFRRDIDMIQAVADQQCDVAIASTSALAAYGSDLSGNPLPAHRTAGATYSLVDVTGAAVTRHAQNPEGAVRLLAWLHTSTPNALFAISGYEFPLYGGATSSTAIAAYADFVENPNRVAESAYSIEDAVRLAERARYP